MFLQSHRNLVKNLFCILMLQNFMELLKSKYPISSTFVRMLRKITLEHFEKSYNFSVNILTGSSSFIHERAKVFENLPKKEKLQNPIELWER